MLLDASIFSRAFASLGISKIRRYLITRETEVVVGKLTSMTGEIIQFSRIKPIVAKSLLDNGSIMEIIEDKKGGIIRARVAAGATFKEVLEVSSRNSLYPAIFPLYLEGTVGGFIATNGSGFGSYKFGFVNYKKQVHFLENKDIAVMSFVNYPELIETSVNIPYSWSALFLENRVVYFVPSIYKEILGVQPDSIQDTKNIVSLISNKIYKILKSGKIPISLRVPQDKFEVVNELNLDFEIGYLIRYNSPENYYVLFSSIDYEELGNIFKFLKAHPYIYPYPSLKDYSEIQKFIINNFDKYEVKVPKDYSEIQDIYLDALKCINCGLCLNSCLAYNATKNILNSPPGRFNRILKGEKVFEYCFGCNKCEYVCPVGIKISRDMEKLPRISPSSDLKIEIEKVSEVLKGEVEKVVNSIYKNQPLVLLFIGCSYKYDRKGVESFLKFIVESGDKIKNYSLRFKIVDGICCGFDSYISGKIREAEEKVKEIRRIKEESGAVYVYFFCPEALYIYNLLSGDKGILVYEIVKDFIKGKIHAGCWAQRLGISGDNNDCAGLFITNYLGKIVSVEKKEDILTICPFSTWKFGATSVYSYLAPTEISTKTTKTSREVEEKIINIVVQAYKEAILSSIDDIAEKVIMWSVGGKGYFALLAIPILRRNFSKRVRALILDSLNREEIARYLASEATIKEISSKIYEILKGMDYNEIAFELTRGIRNSKKLDYTVREIVEKEEFLNVIKEEIIRKAISYNLILDNIRLATQF
ncbi:MAG: 4Fe-4S dicluster domain-containing protein [Sulfolobaceae archaeon]